jgi:integrase
MAGVDLFTISRWVGHTSTAMIEQVYGHLSDEHRKAQMAKIQFTSREQVDFGGELVGLGDE